MSAVHVFCPRCKIVSPREPHELTGIAVICTVCGCRLSQKTIDSALKRQKCDANTPTTNIKSQW